MKQLIIALAVLAFGYNSAFEQVSDADKYCAKMKDGMMKVMHEGEIVASEVKLDDGSVLKNDATIIRKNGTIVNMKDGECVDKAGAITF